jgi:hypothetical protein
MTRTKRPQPLDESRIIARNDSERIIACLDPRNAVIHGNSMNIDITVAFADSTNGTTVALERAKFPETRSSPGCGEK